ncbi:MAG: hypothetical protein FJ276_14585 [Planctomycetes bacterium]|nr:hypothetical protein [Planctomycetota bacterium]
MSSGLLHAQSRELVSTDVAQRYGLERVWFTQVRVNPGRGRIRDIRLHVSGTRAQTISEVVTDQGRKYVYSERHLNAFGEPMGVEGAAKKAAERVELLKADGIAARVEQHVVPDITVYATTDQGMVHALDGETGQTIWASAVGESQYPTSAAAVSEELVAVVNGQTLSVLDARTGAVIEERRISGAPATGAAIIDRTVYVPMLNGQIKAFTFAEKASRWPVIYRSRGAIRFQPTVAGRRVVWPTDLGIISAILAQRPGIRYRLELNEGIAGPLLYSPPQQVLCVTSSGYLYSFDPRNGDVQWRFNTGDETGEPAAIVGETVYVFTRWSGMYAVSAAKGEIEWSAPLAAKFVAATRDNVFATTRNGQLIILDAKTGQVRTQIPTDESNMLFANNQTDRIYVGTHSGVLQCFREIGADWPTIHVPGFEEAAEKPGAKAKEEGTAPEKPVDPFRDPGAVDGAQPRTPAENPFGAAAPDTGKAERKQEPPAKSENPFD